MEATRPRYLRCRQLVWLANLKTRIGALKKMPLLVADHFVALLKPREQRSAQRDYILFGVGVVVTTIVTFIIALVIAD